MSFPMSVIISNKPVNRNKIIMNRRYIVKRILIPQQDKKRIFKALTTFYKSLISLKIDWTNNQIKQQLTPTGIDISMYKRVRISHWPILARIY
jgi:hypothetical protein